MEEEGSHMLREGAKGSEIQSESELRTNKENV